MDFSLVECAHDQAIQAIGKIEFDDIYYQET